MKPFPFQETGIEFLLEKKRAILADDMGCGKTIQAIETVKRSKHRRILVVCPNSLKRNWAAEIEKWYRGAPVSIYEGSASTALSDYREGFFIANYEKIRPDIETKEHITKGGNKTKVEIEHNPLLQYSSKITKDGIKPWDTIIFDEAHRLKNRRAKQTQGAFKLGKACYRCYLLTGTPVQNKMMEIWSLLHLLYPKEFSSLWKFLETYAGARPDWNGVWICEDKPTNPVRFRKEVLSPIFLRRTKEEVLPDLPEKIHQRIHIPLEGAQLKIYKEMEQTFIADFRKQREETEIEDRVIAFNALSQMTRLKQICVAPTIITGSTIQTFPSAKIERLVEVFEETDGKIVVFSQFAKALEYASNRLKEEGIDHVMFTGGIKTKERDENVHRYLTDPACRGFLASIQAGGEGLNLTAGSTAVFLDKAWNPAQNDQAAARLHRIGQKNSVLIYEFYAEDTIEEHLENILQTKDAIIEAVTGFSNKRNFR